MAEPQNGRIGGGVLADNLLRNGLDLAFETDLLYFDVANNRIGINTNAPAADLHVVSTIGGTILEADYINAANITLENNDVISNSGNLNFNAAYNIQASTLETDGIRINDNVISTTQPNSNLEIRPVDSGTVDIYANTNITGSLHATGDITFGGNLTFGNDASDNVEFLADVNSDIIPNANNTYSLGTNTRRWENLYSDLLNGQRVEIEAITVTDTSLALRQGNIFYVSTLGDDTNVGDHQHGAFRTIEHALAVADSSTEGPVTIFIYPGEYEENLPLIVPENTTITGEDIRNVIVKPAAGSESLDVFHLNQNTMVENITAKDFYYDSINDTGYAFRFASGALIVERSPYVRNVTVITADAASGSVPADIYSDPLGLAGSYSSDSVAVDQINYTQSQVEGWIGKLLMTWNGESFPVTFYEIVDVIDEPLDPGAFWRIVLDRNLENAGEEFYQFSIYPNNGETSIIGAAGYVASTDYSRSFLKSSLPPFFDTTVEEDWTCQIGEGLNIVDFVEEDPANSDWWKVNFKSLATITNGLPIFTSPSGGAGVTPAGRGALVDGSVLDSNTTSPSMLFHSATFITPNADCIVMTNGVRVEWLNSFTYFANRGLYATQGSLGFASLATTFGAEIRSIGSANVYGTYGAVADGADTLMYLIGHNFGYIGAGLDYSNDRTLTLQDQEAVELNSGKIYYTSTDADGTFRVGDAFYVDFERGTTSIDAGSVDFSGVSALFIRTGPYVAYIDGERIDLGNIRFNGNTVETLTGDLIWSPATGVFDVSTNNTGFILPRGTTAQRISEQSDLRYNTTTNLFEGFGSANVGFGGIYSDNRLTNINANNVLGNIVFTANNVETARVSSGLLELNGLQTVDAFFNNKRITTTVTNSDLELTPDGTGVVVINNLQFDDGAITNIGAGNLSLANTGRGYVKFDAPTGLVVPSGNDLERPLSPVVGLTRWNTERGYMETYSGTAWIRASGEGEEQVTDAVMGEILDIYTLVLG